MIATTPRWSDNVDWQGKIYSGGWRAGDGGVASATNKATGAALGSLGVASAADVAHASAAAAAAQSAWAARPREERAVVLERARNLLAEHRDEFAWWLVRESGSTGPKAQVEIDFTLAKFDKIVAELRTASFEEVLVDEGGYRSVAQRVPPEPPMYPF